MRGTTAVTALGLVVLLTACTADPGAVANSSMTSTATAAAPSLTLSASRAVVVAVDDLGPGFNPHLLADQSPVGRAVANLVLPSAFRPAAGGGWAVDPSLVKTAVVGATAPFTVTYVLRNEAQWSDGAPVAAEDFRYLWQQMITQPGVIDSAGYGMISDVQSSGGGKTVTVIFTSPYLAWRQLFTGLLPSHLLKDSPGGFTAALDDNLALSASQFSVASVDRNRGEVQLLRNDRFWDAPATLDKILLRRDGTAGQLAEALRTDDAQLAMVGGGVGVRVQVRAVPGLTTSQVAQPTVMQLVVNTQNPRLVNAGVRRGLLGLLDPDVLATVGTGLDATTDPSALRARAQVLAPSEPGYRATAPAALTVAQARALLAAGGYPYVDGRYRQAGGPLTVVVGADRADPTATAVAQAAADELTVAGVAASVSLRPAAELYGSALTTGAVDLVVGRAAVGGDLGTTLASRFGCPTGPGAPPTATAPTAIPTSPPAAASSRPEAPRPATPVLVRAGNVAGLCDPQVDTQVQQALIGAANATDVATALEPVLWSLGAVLPLFQDSVLFSVRSDVVGVNPAGPLLAGPMAGAATWSRMAP